MVRAQRLTYEMYLRVRDFIAAHSDRFPAGSKAGQMLAIIIASITQIEAQESARLKAAAEGYHAGTARRTLKRWMVDIIGISRDLAEKGTPGVTPLKMPRPFNNVTMLEAANRFLEIGATFSDELVQRGLGEHWATAFKEAIEAFATQLGDRRAGRYGVSVAHASTRAAFTNAKDALATLDGIVAIVLRNDPVLLPVWQRCRRVVVPGRVKESGVDATTPETVTTSPVPESAPAQVASDALKKAS